MGATDYLEDELLDHIFGAAAWTAPATLHIGLSTTEIADDGTGITEPVGMGYARVSVANDGVTWDLSSGGMKQNDIALTFPQATGDWGTILEAFVADAASGGNILWTGGLKTTRFVGNGETFEFAASNFKVKIN